MAASRSSSEPAFVLHVWDHVPEEKVRVFVLRGADSNITGMLGKDVAGIRQSFAGEQFKVTVIDYRKVADRETLCRYLVKELKEHRCVILWYTGHGVNVGGAWPAIVLGEGRLCKTDDIYQTLIRYTDDRCLIQVVDACNSYDHKHAYNIEELPDITSASATINPATLLSIRGHAYIISSKYGQASQGTNESGSYLTTRLLRELTSAPSVEIALYRTRGKLPGQNAMYDIHFESAFLDDLDIAELQFEE
jgi:hypothetical protein